MRRKPTLKIIHKVTIAYILMIILPITLVSSIAYYQFFEREKSSILRTQLNLLNQTQEKLNYIFTVSDGLGKTIAKDHRLRNYLASGKVNTYYSENEFYSFISPLFEYSLTGQMVKYHSTNVYIHDNVVEEIGNTFIHDKKLKTQKWYTDFLSSDNQTIWLAPHSKQSLGIEDDDIKKVYSYCRKINSSAGEYLGLLVINIYVEDFYSGFLGLYKAPTEFHFIDYSKNQVYTSSQSSSFDIEYLAKENLINLPYSYISNNRFYTYTLIEDLDLYIAVSSPIQSPLFLSPQLMTALIISALCLISVLFLFYRFVRNIFNTINYKIETVNCIIHNDFKERLPVERDDEISEISKSFNILLDKINALIKDVVNKETAQKDANLKALQYQINPHFIYNVIEVFSNKIELLGEYETSDALASFGKMLRYNLNNETLFSTIDEEIEHVKSFIKIEKIKHGASLSFRVFCPKELYTLKIIRFIMQPIVENCFTHGFENDQIEKKIYVNISTNGEYIEFAVADNGKGIDPKYCKVLNEVFKTSNYKHPNFKNAENKEGIGLMNINERLKLFYHPDCHISISQLNEYTLVSFSLPLIKE